MKDIPIIFSGPMVRAFIDGRKTMTRRLLYSIRKLTKRGPSMLQGHPPPFNPDPETGFPRDHGPGEDYDLTGWHKVRPGDRLWVRENHSVIFGCGFHGDGVSETAYDVHYAAGGDLCHLEWTGPRDATDPYLRATDTQRGKWRPSIHMPRWASRLTLIVTATKIERLQDISEADAMAEGAERAVAGSGMTGALAYTICTYRTGFVHVWQSLHGNWLDNPEVVAITVTVHKANIDTLPKSEAA